MFDLITFNPKIMGSYSTLLVSAPFVTTVPVHMYTASLGNELQIASLTAIVLMIPGAEVAAPAKS